MEALIDEMMACNHPEVDKDYAYSDAWDVIEFDGDGNLLNWCAACWPNILQNKIPNRLVIPLEAGPLKAFKDLNNYQNMGGCWADHPLHCGDGSPPPRPVGPWVGGASPPPRGLMGDFIMRSCETI